MTEGPPSSAAFLRDVRTGELAVTPEHNRARILQRIHPDGHRVYVADTPWWRLAAWFHRTFAWGRG